MLFIRNKPEWLYRRLPLLYAFSGVGIPLVLRTPLAVASGMLLLGASLAIAIMRRRAERLLRQADLDRTTSVLGAPSRLAMTTEHIEAVLPPDTGHQDIDRQHRRLAAAGATLHVLVAHGDDICEIEQLAQELVDLTDAHLNAEIEFLARLTVQRSVSSLAHDRERLRSARQQLVAYKQGLLSSELLVDCVARDLVAQHLREEHPRLPTLREALERLHHV